MCCGSSGYQRQIELKLIDPSWPLSERDSQALAWDDVKPELRDGSMAAWQSMRR